MRNKRMIHWLLATALLLALPAASHAYVYFFTYSSDGSRDDGYRFHRDDIDFPLTYAINKNTTNEGLSLQSIETAIDYSFSVWDNVPTAKISFTDGGWTTINTVAANFVNLVIFDTNADNYKLSDNLGSSVVGLTVNSYSPSNGHIIDSDIIFNDYEYTFTTNQASDLSKKQINLQDVATHEIGHLLGLDHTWIEHATMWPYTRDGQQTLSEDDRAGISNLYPASTFNTAYDSLDGTVYNNDGRPVMGVYVSAVSDSTGQEEVAALTDGLGQYMIKGLRRNTNYYLRARNVELKHVGDWYEMQADSTVYIPKYYPDASNKTSATRITTSQAYKKYDFSLTTATLLARYNVSAQGVTLVPPLGTNTSSNYYWAVRFPAASLPDAFRVHGLTFFNNDVNMTWPQIMLTSGTTTQPDVNNPISLVTNYEGAEQSSSIVEWDAVQLSNSRPLWVVFQFPDKSLVARGDGPGLGAVPNAGFSDWFYSTDGGASFKSYPYDTSYDLKLYLTVEITDAVLVPSVTLSTTSINFGSAKVGRFTYIGLPVGNGGTKDLELWDISCTSLGYVVPNEHIYIGPGSEDTLQIGFRPYSAAVWNGTITMSTNDPTSPSLSIPVTGTGVFAKVQVPSTALTFDSTGLGAAKTLDLKIRSTGEVPLLAWGWATGNPNFTSRAASDTLTIPAGDSALVPVRFAPLSSGSHNAVLTFTTDDSAKTVHQVALSGAAAGDPNAPRCDMSGDGRANIIDLLSFILLARRAPGDPRLDWNGDGAYTIADAVAMLNAIRRGTCPDVAGTAFLAGDITTDPWLETLSDEDRVWLLNNLSSAGLTADERELALAALRSAGGGQSTLPGQYSLEQNQPNPFNPSTTITFSVPEGAGGEVSLKVYGISGRLVRTLAQGYRGPGVHSLFWDGADSAGRRVASGVYIYRLQAGGQAWTRKMVLLK